MLKFSGSAQRSFSFPAGLTMAYAYYSDLPYVFQYLPHISLVKVHADDHFRLLYSTTELGAYNIRMFCDLRAAMEGGRHLIRLVPEETLPTVESTAGFYSTSGRGYFTLESLFLDAGDETIIDFSLALHARLPKPRGMRLMMGSVVNRVADGITNTRMNEVIDGFIKQTVAGFPQWTRERV